MKRWYWLWVFGLLRCSSLYTYSFSVNTGRTDATRLLWENVVKQGYTELQASYFIDTCKTKETENGSARRCVVRLTAIGIAESWRCKKSKNCFWLSDENGVMELEFREATNKRVTSYYKYRYRHREPEDWIEKSHYNCNPAGNWTRNTKIVIEYFRSYFKDI